MKPGALLDLLFPPKCPFCGRITEKNGICPACERELPWTVGREALREGDGLRCAAPLWYEGLAREGLLRFKFRGGASAGALGALVARCAAEELSGEFDTVTWVPVSRKRLRKRGFDQARLLAREAARLWDTEPVELLVKIRDNPPQSGIRERAARRANVLGVYRMAPGAVAAGRRILLIDDICTTGETLRECARVLKDAGAESVVCAAAAHAREQPKKG
ncbi:MAG: phosphoribosyltransferase family protein [Oscillospiraceae bacterium]|nr:phosphoribosyltransferase family protein [Oscillospiraceae bacterium]